MDCRYLYLTNNQLEELSDGIADGKLWSIIYDYLKEPEEFCDYIEETELNARSIDLMDLELGQNIDTAKSVFVAKRCRRECKQTHSPILAEMYRLEFRVE